MKKYRLRSLVTLLSFTIFVLSSCASIEAPDKVVTNAFAALKANDLQTVAKYLDVSKVENFGDISKPLDQDTAEISKVLLSKLNAKVISTQINKDTAVVKTEVTTIDMKSVFGKYVVQAFAQAFSSLGNSSSQSEQDISKMFLDLINNETATVTNTVDINLSKVDKAWKINVDEKLQDAMSGGMNTAAKDMENSFKSFGSNSTESNTTTETMSDTETLFEVDNFITSDIWNDGFCDISYFISDGKNSVGETMDIDFTISQLDKAMVKLDEYNNKINAMTEIKTADAKNIWEKLYPQIQGLYAKLKESTPKANDATYDFDTGLYSQYSEAFSDAVNTLQQ